MTTERAGDKPLPLGGEVQQGPAEEWRTCELKYGHVYSRGRSGPLRDGYATCRLCGAHENERAITAPCPQNPLIARSAHEPPAEPKPDRPDWEAIIRLGESVDWTAQPNAPAPECDHAAKMADAAMEFLSELPAEERERRIRAFEEATLEAPEPPDRLRSEARRLCDAIAGYSAAVSQKYHDEPLGCRDCDEIHAALVRVVRDSAEYVAEDWALDTDRKLAAKPRLHLNDGKDQYRWIAATLRSWWGLTEGEK